MFSVGPALTIAEAHRFVEGYSRQLPAKRHVLSQVLGMEPTHRTPFYFGLAAYEEQFVALDECVRRRLAVTTNVQRQIAGFLALAYHYAHQATPSQVFDALLGIASTRTVRLEQFMAEPFLELLVTEGDLRWRPSHDLIAVEILQQILSAGAETRELWTQNLSTWARDFAELCANRERTPSKDLMDLLRRLFILREQREYLGTTEESLRRQHSPLLGDIPSPEGRLGVLDHLTRLFLEEPHFWAHLGRCQMLEFQDDVNALISIDRAIALADTDHVLYHIKGMIVGRKATILISEATQQRDTSNQTLEVIPK